jgi:5'(3')-deoxyribonucleotidase
MIIVNQDKDNVINYDNVKSLWIDDNVLDKTNTTFYINADDDFLGEYKTEERAKEVLKEIVEKYSSYLKLKGGVAFMQGGMNIQPNIFNIPKVYEMPTE